VIEKLQKAIMMWKYTDLWL